MLRYWRCILAQSFLKALLWIVLLGAAGYAAFKMSDCPTNQCVDQQKMKGKR
jgi:hypothetical protein